MSSNRLRFLLVLLLALALPLKALAAAGATACGPAGHAAAAPDTTSARAVDHGSHAHHHAAAADEAVDGIDNVTVPNAGGGHPATAKLKCGACSPCCAAGLPALDRTVPALPDFGGIAIPFADRAHPDITVAVPHGPPRRQSSC